MSEDVVYASQSVVLAHAGRRVQVRAGEPWAADDPLVAAYPDMFSGQVRAVRSTEDPRGYREYEPPVERATRAPGEKRPVRHGQSRDGKDTQGTGAEGGAGDK